MTQHARPGQHGKPRPQFSLLILEALDDWRQALQERAQARARLIAATTREARQGAVQSVDRWGMIAMRAEKRLKEALEAEVAT